MKINKLDAKIILSAFEIMGCPKSCPHQRLNKYDEQGNQTMICPGFCVDLENKIREFVIGRINLEKAGLI